MQTMAESARAFLSMGLSPNELPNGIIRAQMKFEIVESDVPGRPWLGFKDAGYTISRQGNRTAVTRTTTIISRLSPAWYWRRLEAIGVHTEHKYLFEALKNKLEASK